MLTIGGAAGHIVIASLKTSSNTAEVKVRSFLYFIELVLLHKSNRAKIIHIIMQNMFLPQNDTYIS